MAKEKFPEEEERENESTEDGESNTNSMKPQFKTTVKVTMVSEEDQQELMESFSKPIQELDNALAEQHKQEQDTMKMLINDTVRMEQEVKKADERVQEMHTKVELMKLDVEAEKANTKGKEDRIKEMENEMVMLIVAKKSEKKEKKKGRTMEDVDSKAEEIKTKYGSKDEDDSNEPKLPYNEVYEKRIKHLNFRLRRLAADDEEKSKRIINLENQLEVTGEYANELEKEVDSAKIDAIKKRLADKEKKKYVKYYDPANIVSSNGNGQKSSVCVIQ